MADPNFTFIPVTFGADNPQCFVPEVKKRTSMFMLALNLVTGILAALAAPRFGQLSDRYGRTKLLALASCGGVMAELITILCARYPDTIHYNWLILAAFCDGATGSYTSGTILSSSYTSDCTPPSKRAVSIGYVQACLFTGLAFGPILAGYFVTFTGSLLSIFYVTLGCHIFFILVVGFVVPESLSERRRARAWEKHAQETQAHGLNGNPWRDSVHVANVLSPLKALWPSKPGATSALRMNLAALAGVDMVLVGVAVSAGPVILLYCESEDTWGWGTLESSRFMSSVSLVRVVILLLILPTINYFGRTRPAARRARESGTPTVDVNAGADNLDLWMLRVALVSDVIGSLGYLLARSEALFVFSGMLTALGGLGSATIQAAVTKHVPAEQVGQVLGAIGLLHGAARVVGPIAFNSLYSATVGKFDQAIFALLAGMYIMALLASFTVRPRGKHLPPRPSSFGSLVLRCPQYFSGKVRSRSKSGNLSCVRIGVTMTLLLTNGLILSSEAARHPKIKSLQTFKPARCWLWLKYFLVGSYGRTCLDSTMQTLLKVIWIWEAISQAHCFRQGTRGAYIMRLIFSSVIVT